MRLAAALAFSLMSLVWCVSAHALPPHAERDPVQYVAISFDGSRSVDIWKATRAFAHEHDIRFTFFLSCTYFLHRGNRRLYRAPGRAIGRSGIGFAASAEEIAERLEQINLARAEGHDLGSHACGHFDGRHWSETQWEAEFNSFKSILTDAYTNNDLVGEPGDWAEIVDLEIRGFRAPFLARNAAMDRVLARRGFRYDASRIGHWDALPERRADGVWNFPLAVIPEGGSKRPVVLSMDYNLYVRHSRARELPERAAEFRERTLKAYMRYFAKSYYGNRTPVHIGHHFSEWNGGAYWDALKAFASTVCAYRDVECVGYSELADALESIELAKSVPDAFNVEEIRTLSARSR